MVNKRTNKDVLVGVLKNKRDLEILLEQKWYRIPSLFMPKRKFKYLAFYQPESFKADGKKIEYYAKVKSMRTVKRNEILPRENDHPKKNEKYYQILVHKIEKLKTPIRNIVPRRISFGFTSLKTLRRGGNILSLYGVYSGEEILKDEMRKLGITATSQFQTGDKKHHYRIDFVIFCKNGKIAIECDNEKAHSGKLQKEKDQAKNAYLKKAGFVVLRFKEKEMNSDLSRCLTKIQKNVLRLGGIALLS